ncbi:MAG: hypothetical protein KH135_04770, partial [Firmicutes bacterium]|nr:hypothetical protein [Bacillota bacterium]
TQVAYTIGGEARKKITNFTPHTACTNISTDKVGLMTFEDYVYALDGTVNGTVGGSFLDKDELEWTLTPTGESNKVWHTYYHNPSHLEKDWNTTQTYGKGVRPVIYLDNSVFLTGGTGTKADPYMIFGDEKGTSGESINKQNPGEYVYLTEKNPYTNTTKKEAFRIVQIESNGTTKLERVSVLRSLPSTISTNSDYYVQYYSDTRDASNTNWCAYVSGTWYTAGCTGHNYFRPTEGTGAFEKDKGMNIAYFLNNATNSYKNWLQNQSLLTTYSYDLPVYRYNGDYAIGLDRSKDTTGQSAYQNNTYDGKANVLIGLPQAGEFLSGNDININYWYINRAAGSPSTASVVDSDGGSYAYYAGHPYLAVRPVLHLKSDIKIKSGNGTPSSPYVIE